MYFPYLRGRQFELIALRELLEKQSEQLTLFECSDIGGCGCFVEE